MPTRAREYSRGEAWIYVVVIVGALLSIGLFFSGAIPLEMQRLDTMPVRLGPRRLQHAAKIDRGAAIA